jgi:hypothetical protein
MPYKPKIVTRTLTTTTVTEDLIPKNAGLTNSELDSNFLNLRDQTFGITDGANSSNIAAGDTITFASGSGISMGLSGRTLTITNTGSGGGGGGSSTGTVTFANSIISSSVTNGNIQIDPNGSGQVEVVGGFNISQDNSGGGGVGSLARFLESGIDFNHNGNDTNHFKVWGPYGQAAGKNPVLECAIDDEDDALNSTNGYVKIMNLKYPTVDGTNGQVLATNGAGTLAFITPSGGGGGSANTGTILFSGNTISTVNTNENIILDPAGTGTIQLNANLDTNDNVITNSTGDLNVKFNKDIVLTKVTSSAILVNSAVKFLTVGVSGGASIGIGYDSTTNGNNNDTAIHCKGLGRLNFYQSDTTGLTSTTIGANGAASAITANPVGYLKIKVNGTEYQVPYYNV